MFNVFVIEIFVLCVWWKFIGMWYVYIESCFFFIFCKYFLGIGKKLWFDFLSGLLYFIIRGWCIKSKLLGVDCEMNVLRMLFVGNIVKNILFIFLDLCIIRLLNKFIKFVLKNCC